MCVLWQDKAWDEYLYWQNSDKKKLKKINDLIKDIARNGLNAIGKIEALKGNLQGFYSARIDDKNRLVFKIVNNNIEIYACALHYGDK